MDYIKDLRKHVGHKTLLIPHSVVLVLKDNKVLIEERSDDGMYDFPGGGIDVDEDAEDAAKRELLEETGLEAISIKFFRLYSGSITHYVYANGDEISGVDAFYIVDRYLGKLNPQKEEVNSLFFMNIDDIPLNKLNPRNKQVLIDLKNYLLKK